MSRPREWPLSRILCRSASSDEAGRDWCKNFSSSKLRQYTGAISAPIDPRPTSTTTAAATRHAGTRPEPALGSAAPLTGAAQGPWRQRKARPTYRRSRSIRGYRGLRFAVLPLSGCHGRRGRCTRSAAAQAAACGSTNPFRPACAGDAGKRGNDSAGRGCTDTAARRRPETRCQPLRCKPDRNRNAMPERCKSKEAKARGSSWPSAIRRKPLRRLPVFPRGNPSTAYPLDASFQCKVSVSRPASLLCPENIADEKRKIGRALSQSPHEIWIPRFTERHIQPEPVAFGDQPPLQVAPDPVKHLKLKGLWRDLAAPGEALCLVDHFLIVRGNGRIRTGGQEDFHQVHEIAVDIRFGLISNFRRLEIGALAEADPDAPPA